MTREETLQYLNNLKEWCKDQYSSDGREVWKKDIEALKMVIKALEQEPVLDKIRAEIEASRWTDKDMRIERNALASGLDKALEIIDKYKAESEVLEVIDKHISGKEANE